MRYDTIAINKELVPYTFSILLCGEVYDFRIDYNETYGFFTIRLSKNGEVVCMGEKIVYGKPLFDEIFEHGKFPSVEIIPFDISGENTAVTFDNLSETVHLIINNKEDDVLGREIVKYGSVAQNTNANDSPTYPDIQTTVGVQTVVLESGVLPETGDENTIYFVKTDEDSVDNKYTEYMYVNGAWEKLTSDTTVSVDGASLNVEVIDCGDATISE